VVYRGRPGLVAATTNSDKLVFIETPGEKYRVLFARKQTF
jgi:hypothetical protein